METYPFSSVGMLQQLWCLPQYEYRYEWAPLHREDIFLKKKQKQKETRKGILFCSECYAKSMVTTFYSAVSFEMFINQTEEFHLSCNRILAS